MANKYPFERFLRFRLAGMRSWSPADCLFWLSEGGTWIPVFFLVASTHLRWRWQLAGLPTYWLVPIRYHNQTCPLTFGVRFELSAENSMAGLSADRNSRLGPWWSRPRLTLTNSGLSLVRSSESIFIYKRRVRNYTLQIPWLTGGFFHIWGCLRCLSDSLIFRGSEGVWGMLPCSVMPKKFEWLTHIWRGQRIWSEWIKIGKGTTNRILTW